MKTASKKLDKCQVELTVTLDENEAKAIIKDVEKAFCREAKVPGFRPGKVPVELIRRDFADGLKQECERAAFQRNISEAVKAEKLDEVAITEVNDLKCTAEGGGFTAIIEVKPVFKLPKYKGLDIEKRDVTVKDEEVAEQLQRLREGHAKYEDAKEGDAVAVGDFVQIDYSGSVGGKPILDVAPEAKIVAGGTGFWTQVEEGRFLKEILDALVGMKAGETKEGVKAKFDKEAAPEGLKGAKAEYNVTLKSFRRRILPEDAELCEKMKVESIDKLVETIKTEMQRAADEGEARRREDAAIDLLLRKSDFDVPGTQVRSIMDRYLQDLAQRAQYSGLDASYFEKNADKIRKDAEENATKQVRVWYLIDAIAREEKIEAKDEERGKKVVDFLLANAK